MCERGVLSEYPAARARASYWFDNHPVILPDLGISVHFIIAPNQQCLSTLRAAASQLNKPLCGRAREGLLSVGQSKDSCSP